MISYQSHIDRGLSAVLEERAVCERVRLKDLRMIIFSDQHRGQKTGADDFFPCQEVYHASLEHYLTEGHRLVLLGDVEELWECSPGQVVKTYEETLRLEQRFHDAGGYFRVYGNHDDVWTTAWEFNLHLEKFICDKNGVGSVQEALALTVVDDDESYLGRMLLTHGHQGTPDSDRFAPLSRFLVRYVWRPLQRLLLIGSNTPSQDYGLRMKHETAMFDWSARQRGLVLVTGHTHHPVFVSHTHESQLVMELEKLRERRAKCDSRDQCLLLDEEIGELAAVLERQIAAGKGPVFTAPETVRPCYFNTGCCSFSDGDITGIEIADGEIRLVRWSDGASGIRPKVLRRADLRWVFEHCQGEEGM